MEGMTINKVVVIGFDGLDPRLVSRLLKAGQLPHLARLNEQGGYTRVATTRPAQTPVAWSTFATGTNPGGHGVFDFIRRNTKSYLPEFGLNRYEQKNAFLPPKSVNLRRGTPIWDILKAAGLSATVLRCPCTYPPDSVRGRMLAGMGVPDLRGGLGTSAFYATGDAVKPRESENVVRLQALGDGTFSTYLIGPRNPKTGSDCRLDATLKVDSASSRVTLNTEGTPRELSLPERCWSEWLRVKFKLGMLQSVRGMLRFYLVQREPEPVFYASPVNFDPDSPMFPISSPPEYSGELGQRIGLFYTTGMVEDTTGLNNERISEEAFLDQCKIAWRDRESMMFAELESLEEGFFYCLFDTPDRIQHMFWRFGEPAHPAHRSSTVVGDFTQVIDDCYRRCDAVIGKVMEFIDQDTLLVVLSDHGFNSFHRGVHVNTWLHDNGFLALRDGIRPGADAGDFLRQVDWRRTRAYALGLSGIYLNIQGREEQGIVAPEDVPAVKTSLAKALTGLVDPEREGAISIRRVLPREDVYRGPFLEEAPDVLVDFAPGYRISWSSSMGGVAEGHFEDNTRKWSGDHIIDPEHVPGVLFMNRPFQTDRARLSDMAPTILAAFGLPKGPAMEGESLLP
jgi:predicted AlkP superfamily phosphohydrolase/phosphomutase